MRTYLLGIGSLLITLGLVMLFRDFMEHRSVPGMLLGLAFVIYGILRLRQRNSIPNKS